MISVGVGITQARTWFGDHAQSGGLVSERGSHHIDLQRAVGGEVRRVRGVRGAVPLAIGAGTPRGPGLRLTPGQDQTDGFFIARFDSP